MAKTNGETKGVRDISGEDSIDDLEDAFEVEDSGLHEITAEMIEASARQDKHDRKCASYARRVKARARRTEQILAGEKVPAFDEQL